MRSRSDRKAFTLIELLVVIAILALLITIVAYGMNRVINHSKVSATRVTLANLRSMVTEFEVTAKGLTRQPGGIWYKDNRYPPNPGDQLLAGENIWQDGNPSDGVLGGSNLVEPDAALAPGDVRKEANESLTSAGGKPNQRYMSDGMANTQAVMGLLRQAPANKTTLAQLPQSQLIEEVPTAISDALGNGNPPKLNQSQGTRRLDPPLVLDAWGNPIMFVPAGGLCGDGAGAASPNSMWLGGAAGSTGALEVIAQTQTNQVFGANQRGPIKSPDGRPFWCSAGPDGNFCTADDNIYSFEQ